METEEALLADLHRQLVAAHQPLGLSVDEIDRFTAAGADFEVYRCGARGVLAFFGDYLVVTLPDKDDLVASRRVYQLIAERLAERGKILHMVHPRNFPSIKSTRRLGARPLGYDADGYMHYELTPGTFRPFEKFRPHPEDPDHGQEVAAAESA
jgi:hypothetical protein